MASSINLKQTQHQGNKAADANKTHTARSLRSESPNGHPNSRTATVAPSILASIKNLLLA